MHAQRTPLRGRESSTKPLLGMNGNGGLPKTAVQDGRTMPARRRRRTPPEVAAFGVHPFAGGELALHGGHGLEQKLDSPRAAWKPGADICARMAADGLLRIADGKLLDQKRRQILGDRRFGERPLSGSPPHGARPCSPRPRWPPGKRRDRLPRCRACWRTRQRTPDHATAPRRGRRHGPGPDRCGRRTAPAAGARTCAGSSPTGAGGARTGGAETP